MKKHLDIKIFGLVQGVFFRAGAKHEAEKFDIVGFIRNESDRTVYIEVEGEEKDLDKFVNWCKEGPDLAKVEKIEIQSSTLKNFKTFDRDFEDYLN